MKRPRVPQGTRGLSFRRLTQVEPGQGDKCRHYCRDGKRAHRINTNRPSRPVHVTSDNRDRAREHVECDVESAHMVTDARTAAEDEKLDHIADETNPRTGLHRTDVNNVLGIESFKSFAQYPRDSEHEEPEQALCPDALELMSTRMADVPRSVH